MKMRQLALLLFFFCFAALSGGCMDITGRGLAKLDHTVDIQLREKYPRVGYVYCMRGWLGIFSEGMDALAEKIDKQVGAPAVSVANEEWTRLENWLVEEHKA